MPALTKHASCWGHVSAIGAWVWKVCEMVSNLVWTKLFKFQWDIIKTNFDCLKPSWFWWYLTQLLMVSFKLIGRRRYPKLLVSVVKWVDWQWTVIQQQFMTMTEQCDAAAAAAQGNKQVQYISSHHTDSTPQWWQYKSIANQCNQVHQ